jgi:hypothetical protein
MSHSEDLSIQTVRPSFVAEVQCLVSIRELAHHLGHCIRRIGELAEISNLALPTRLSHRNSIPRFGGIDSDECLPTSPHGSSPVR